VLKTTFPENNFLKKININTNNTWNTNTINTWNTNTINTWNTNTINTWNYNINNYEIILDNYQKQTKKLFKEAIWDKNTMILLWNIRNLIAKTKIEFINKKDISQKIIIIEKMIEKAINKLN
jgi:hypothetical protein